MEMRTIRRWIALLALAIIFLAAAGMPAALSPSVAMGDNYQNTLQTEFLSQQQSNGTPGVDPDHGSPGSSFTVSGAGFRSFDTVESIKLGGREVLGSRTINTDADGSFVADNLLVPGLDPGSYSLVITVGTGSQETTAVTTFEVTAQPSQTAQGSPPALGLAPLINADNLVRVFYFDNTTKGWLFFDPRPEFAADNTIRELRDRQPYWLKVRRDQTATLNGKSQPLNCINEGTAGEDCWNLLVW